MICKLYFHNQKEMQFDYFLGYLSGNAGKANSIAAALDSGQSLVQSLEVWLEENHSVSTCGHLFSTVFGGVLFSAYWLLNLIYPS